MQWYTCEILFRPDTPELAYLPECPYPCGSDVASWVAIQHGAEATSGSLNLYDFATGQNRSYPLNGRPGFAFPTDDPETFVVGLERRLQLFNLRTGSYSDLCPTVIDADVEGTIINDGVVFEDGLIFGCKDLASRDPKAGLYLWRRADRQLVRLRSDQICSNGKVVQRDGAGWRLLDIDSPKRMVLAYRLDVPSGQLSEPEIALDLRDDEAVPDGMVATPDGRGAIIAFYNSQPADWGEVRQYDLQSRQVQAMWRLPESPRATCPQLVEVGGQVKLLATSAVEDMPPDQQSQSPNAGCLFVGETVFQSLPSTPIFTL
jgi:sugar lactone lactonase YvrE